MLDPRLKFLRSHASDRGRLARMAATPWAGLWPTWKTHISRLLGKLGLRDRRGAGL
jgi:hypothetical protein